MPQSFHPLIESRRDQMFRCFPCWSRRKSNTWRDYVTAAGFVELDHYYRPPGLPRERQPWLATVWREA